MIIVHAGMHKTGSSSIQETFAKLDGNRVDCAPWRAANYSALFFALFHPYPEEQGGFRFSGIGPDGIEKLRNKWGKRLRQMLERRREQQATRPMIISAEVVVSYSRGGEEAVKKMADYLRSHSSEDVCVIAYVRPPRSFISSAFQQRIKAGIEINLANLKIWPHYRERFGKLDRVFGPENVTLKPFQRERLEGGDVVLDFAREIGITLDPGEVVRTNESLSLEAVAMLYVQTWFGDRFEPGTRREAQRRRSFVNRISRLGSRRFVLSDNLTNPLVEANRTDLDWMEARLDAPLSEPPVPEGEGIGSEAELIAAALAARPLVEDRIAQLVAGLPAHEIPDYDSSALGVPDADRPVYELARRLDFLKGPAQAPAPKEAEEKR